MHALLESPGEPTKEVLTVHETRALRDTRRMLGTASTVDVFRRGRRPPQTTRSS